jgi:hypothetical protein
MTPLWLVQKRRMKPEKVDRVVAASQLVLVMLCVKDWDDPVSEVIARKVVAIEDTGIYEPTKIAALVMKELVQGSASAPIKSAGGPAEH